MAEVFAEKESVFFVGATGDKTGVSTAGGVTKDAWDANPVLADYVGANGANICIGTSCTITEGAGSKVQLNKAGAFVGALIGMLAYCEFTGGGAYGSSDDDRYEIQAVDPSGDWIKIDLAYVAPAGSVGHAYCGGAFGMASQAIDNTDATDYNVEIFTNKDEGLSTSLDCDGNWGSRANGTYKRLKGFTTTVEDTGKVTYTDSGAGDGIRLFSLNMIVENCIANGFSGIGMRSFSSSMRGGKFINCESNNNTGRGFYLSQGYEIIFINCTADGNGSHGFDVSYAGGLPRGTFINCISSDNTGNGFMLGGGTACIAIGCIADSNGTGGTKYSGFRIYSVSNFKSSCYNCISYGSGKHGFEMSVSNGGGFLVNCIADYNGITDAGCWGFYDVPTGANWEPAIVMNCCSYNNGSGGTNDYLLVFPQRDSISTDPLFVDAVGGDFELAPNSPCINAGLATSQAGYTTMGAVLPRVFDGRLRSRTYNPGRISIIR